MAGGIEIPGQGVATIPLTVEFVPGPRADMAAAQIQNTAGVKLWMTGGFSKLERAAIDLLPVVVEQRRLAQANMDMPDGSHRDIEYPPGDLAEFWAAESVELAARVLAACAAEETLASEGNPKPEGKS